MLKQTNFKFLLLFSFAFSFLVFLSSCKKDIDEIQEKNPPNTEQHSEFTGNSKREIGELMKWESPTRAQIEAVGRQILMTSEYRDVVSFLARNGKPEWGEARLIKDFGEGNFSISVPTVINDVIMGVLFINMKESKASFFFASVAGLQMPLDDLISSVGGENAAMSIISFLAHQQHKNGWVNGILVEHLQNRALQEFFSTTEGEKGWCVEEVTIIDISWEPVQQHVASVNYNPLNVGLASSTFVNYAIHGNVTEVSGNATTTVYHFIYWCPDEEGYGDDYSSVWTTNSIRQSGGGGGAYNGGSPTWEYTGTNWHEENIECLLSFDDPWAEALMENFQEELLAEACNTPSEYIIQNTINTAFNDACNSMDTGGESIFPPLDESEAISTEDVMSEVMEGLASNSIYAAGQFVCEVCEGNPDPTCDNDFENCEGEIDYADCVIETFAEMYGLSENIAAAVLNEDLSVLSDHFDANITSIVIGDEYLYGLDDEGILHIYIEPIDMNTATEEEIFNQFTEVLVAIAEYHCETDEYEPIDWRDYFDNIQQVTIETTQNGCQFNTHFTTYLGNQFIMDTAPAAASSNGSGQWLYTYYFNGTTLPALTIACTEECSAAFDTNVIYRDCD